LDEKLKALDALQKIDLAILDLNRSGEAFPKRLAELEKELGAARTAWEAEEARLADNERQRRELEQRLEDEKDKVKKWEARLTEQRTTREYSALAREIDITKKSNLTMGEELAALQKVREDLENASLEKKDALDAKQQTVGKEAEELKTRIAELDGRVKELQVKRTDETKKVDGALLGRYETVRRRRGGVALVPVRGGTCSGCQIKIPPQLYNQLRSGLPFDYCRSCNRIIYAEDAG
jgi:predicted  nucleic acid-binding Zn-ribbon protein